MRAFLRMGIGLFLAGTAWAEGPPADEKFWRSCKSDQECVLIEGICGPIAVNAAYQSAAQLYYRERSTKARCKNQFWLPKADLARCRIEACEAVTK